MKTKVWVLLLSVALLIALSACSAAKPRTVLTVEQFTDLMEDEELTVVDATSQFEAGVVEAVMIAYNDDFQIEFYVVSSVEQAEDDFAGNKQDFEDLEGSSTTGSLSGPNYDVYSKTTSDGFYVVSRTENTFIYVAEEVEDKEAIRELLIKLGY